MADKLCPECGANPCYRICPTQDPYQGDQRRENEDYEFNARYDSVSERYMEHCPKHGPYAGDCGGCEAEHYANEDVIPCPDCEDNPDRYAPDPCPSCKRGPEGFRPNDDGTVTYISPTGGEHTYDPDQAFPRENDSDHIPF